jgi:hypothetical protein
MFFLLNLSFILGCQPSFREELIFTFYPHCMKNSPDEKYTENFLSGLLKFVRWLDKRYCTAWYPLVKDYFLSANSELKAQC